MHSLHIAFKRTITNKTYAVCSCPAQKQSGVFCRGWEVEWEERARPQEDLRGPRSKQQRCQPSARDSVLMLKNRARINTHSSHFSSFFLFQNAGSLSWHIISQLLPLTSCREFRLLHCLDFTRPLSKATQNFTNLQKGV